MIKSQVPQKVTSGVLAAGCNSPAHWARDLCKPSKDLEKTVSADFHLNNKEAKCELKVKYNNKTLQFFALSPNTSVLCWTGCSCITHTLSHSTRSWQHASCSWGSLQLRLGCWSNNSANSHPSPGAFNRRVLHSCMVLQCSNPPHQPCHQRHLVNCDWMLVPYTNRQPSNPRRHQTCWASSHWSHTVSGTPCHGAGHLFHSTLTHPSSANAQRLKSRHPFVLAAQHLMSSSDKSNMCGAVGRSPMECGVDRQPHKTPHFHPRHQHPPPRMTLLRIAWVWLNCLRTGVRHSAPACTNGVGPPLQPVSVVQKNKPSTMLSSNVQSIDLPVNCMAWWFWMMRQSNGCSTPALRPSVAKQVVSTTSSKEEEEFNLMGGDSSVVE